MTPVTVHRDSPPIAATMAPLRYVPGPRVTAKPVSWARSWPPPAAVSHQARLLRNLGLVTGTRNGKNIAGPSTMRETYLEPFSSLRLDYLMSLQDERTGVDALMRAVAAGTGKVLTGIIRFWSPLGH
jgi:hypothetical protein